MQCTVMCRTIFHQGISRYPTYPFWDKEFWLTVKIMTWLTVKSMKLYFIVDLKKNCDVPGRFNFAKPEVSH